MSATLIPFRSRLTAWYGILLALSYLMLGLGLYLGLRGLLLEGFEEQLQKQSALTLANISQSSQGPVIDPVMLATLQDDEHFVRIITPDGTMILDTAGQFDADPITPKVIASALLGHTRQFTIGAREESFGTVVSPIKAGETIVGVLQIGISRGDIEETLRLVVIVLGIAAPIVLLFAVVGGYIVAGRAIAPVATITNLAAELDGTDLHARLNLNLPDDELGRLARTFDSMLARIEGAFDRQRRFTGDAAHELRTPLTMMRGEVDLALRSPKTADEYRASLGELDRDLERMTGLVSSLLTLARADAGQMAIAAVRFDLAATIDGVIELYRPYAATRSIDLRALTQPLLFIGDEDLIIQVVVNLVENAFAHTPEHGSITIGCSGGTQQVSLWIEDTGIGIAPEHLDHIFDRFYRVDEGRTRERGGSGLGLSICRSIVELHRGTITASSSPGHGARFAITLPIT